MNINDILNKVSRSLQDTADQGKDFLFDLITGETTSLHEQTYAIVSSAIGKGYRLLFDSDNHMDVYESTLVGGVEQLTLVCQSTLDEEQEYLNDVITGYGGTINSLLKDVSNSVNVNTLFKDITDAFRASTGEIPTDRIISMIDEYKDALQGDYSTLKSMLVSMPDHIDAVTWLNVYQQIASNALNTVQNQSSFDMYDHKAVVHGLIGSVFIDAVITGVTVVASIVLKTAAIISLILNSVVTKFVNLLNTPFNADYKVNASIKNTNFNTALVCGSVLDFTSQVPDSFYLNRGYASYYLWDHKYINVLPQCEIKWEELNDTVPIITLPTNSDEVVSYSGSLLTNIMSNGYDENYSYSETELYSLSDLDYDKQLLVNFALFIADSLHDTNPGHGKSLTPFVYTPFGLPHMDAVIEAYINNGRWAGSTDSEKVALIATIGYMIIGNFEDARTYQYYGNHRDKILEAYAIIASYSYNGSPVENFNIQLLGQSASEVLDDLETTLINNQILSPSYINGIQPLLNIPQIQKVVIPDYTENAFAKTLLYAGITAAAAVTTMVLVKTSVSRKLRYWATTKRAALSAQKAAYDANPTYTNWLQLDKATRRYNKVANLVGLATYDYINDWSEYPQSAEGVSSSTASVLSANLDSIRMLIKSS